MGVNDAGYQWYSKMIKWFDMDRFGVFHSHGSTPKMMVDVMENSIYKLG